ncbi:MAG: hypothetical protein AB1489_34570 [Acidobacteriota bacterium]
MKLEAEFYQNLFKSLSARPQSAMPAKGWGSYPQLTEQMKKLLEEASARHIFIIELTGKQITSYGDLGHIDITDLVSLVVSKMLACNALAELVNGQRFSAASIEGKRWGAHFSLLGEHAVMMVIFDDQTNIDLVGLRVRRATSNLLAVLTAADAAARGGKVSQ